MKRNLLILALAILAGCKKDQDTGDSQMPIIMLTAPTNNQTFSAGESVNISATINDNTIVRELHVEIINTTTGAFLAHEHYVPNAAHYKLSRSFVAQANSTYKIKVEAEDGTRNKAKAEVTITSN